MLIWFYAKYVIRQIDFLACFLTFNIYNIKFHCQLLF